MAEVNTVPEDLPNRQLMDSHPRQQSYFTACAFVSFRRTVVKMLYLVGLGLADETDITVKGLEIVKKADRVYLEAYTSILLVDRQKLVRSTERCADRHTDTL